MVQTEEVDQVCEDSRRSSASNGERKKAVTFAEEEHKYETSGLHDKLLKKNPLLDEYGKCQYSTSTRAIASPWTGGFGYTSPAKARADSMLYDSLSYLLKGPEVSQKTRKTSKMATAGGIGWKVADAQDLTPIPVKRRTSKDTYTFTKQCECNQTHSYLNSFETESSNSINGLSPIRRPAPLQRRRESSLGQGEVRNISTHFLGKRKITLDNTVLNFKTPSYATLRQNIPHHYQVPTHKPNYTVFRKTESQLSKSMSGMPPSAQSSTYSLNE
eukprot:Nk52_evm36s1073 gene=Nk52_evmTU36s1073